MSVGDENDGVREDTGASAHETAPRPSTSKGQPICPNPQCSYDKHEAGANFCILCGTLLYTHCEDCLAHSPQYARFCHYCGTDLDELRELREQDKQ